MLYLHFISKESWLVLTLFSNFTILLTMVVMLLKMISIHKSCFQFKIWFLKVILMMLLLFFEYLIVTSQFFKFKPRQFNLT